MISLSKLNPKYRITMDESYYHECPEIRKEDRHWYERIPCRGGAFIYLYSETPPILKLWTPQMKSARAIAKKIPQISDLEAMWLDGEAVLPFPLEFLDVVAKMAGAKKKKPGRKLSARERSKLIEAGRAHRFTGKSTGLQTENLA